MSAPLEKPLVFRCQGEELVGIVHPAVSPSRRLGVLIVVGGPQYRVGSHRQFTLMARSLAAAGYPVMRFDHRGIGDSSGEPRSFEAIGADIRTAMDTFLREVPSLDRIVLWGLCDAASAILLGGINGNRLGGLVLVNPWVRTSAGEATAYIKHYYANRLLQSSFWRELLGGRIRVGRSVGDYLLTWRRSLRGRDAGATSFVERMCRCLADSQAPVLLLLSGRDLVAREFADLSQESAAWRGALERVQLTRVTLDAADHTFSAREALEAATEACRIWLDRLSSTSGAAPQRKQA